MALQGLGYYLGVGGHGSTSCARPGSWLLALGSWALLQLYSMYLVPTGRPAHFTDITRKIMHQTGLFSAHGLSSALRHSPS
eukprot:COSAG01_NODE_1619_length_9715_cov_29.912958_5_plen_81_part_00